MRSFKSLFLVLVQFGCLAVLLFTGPLLSPAPYVIFLQLFSVMLGIWSILVMIPGRLSVFPDVVKGASLIGKGPYKLIRHPMYLSVILFALALILGHFTWLRLTVFLLLLADLLYKIHYEESMLIKAFRDYKDYRAGTKKLIPFIY